jgi:hypothetical protein
MCCGRRRAAWRSALLPSRTAASSTPVASGSSARNRLGQTQGAPAKALSSAVMLEYTEVAPIRVWGAATGQPYDFSGAHPVHAMDARDAAVLARSSLFRRAGG